MSVEKRKPKSLYEPTESMLAAQREFERSRKEIRPEDDPFWEKRGGKCGKSHLKHEEVPERSPKTLRESAEMVQPLPTDSRLLTPTQATIFASYHKEETPKEKHIAALPPNSHLLTPTKASSLGEYHPPPKSSPRSNSSDTAPVTSSSSSQIYSPPPNSRLLELTTNRKCAIYEKKIIDTDPREDGWRSIITPGDSKSPLPAPPEVHHDNPYKNVKSKLHNPTVASVHQKWCDPRSSSEDAELFDSVVDSQIYGGRSGSESVPTSPRSARNQKRFSQIHSRLFEPTAAHLASQWCNRPNSPPVVTATVNRRHSARNTDTVPAVQAKTTHAQLHKQRAKYVRPDDGDLAKGKRAPAAESKRSKSVPVYGRIYIPPPPPVTERRSSWKPSSHVDHFGEPSSPFATLVNDTQTPLANRRTGVEALALQLNGTGNTDPEMMVADTESSFHPDQDEDHAKESRLSRLFPEVTEACEVIKEEINPLVPPTQEQNDEPTLQQEQLDGNPDGRFEDREKVVYEIERE